MPDSTGGAPHEQRYDSSSPSRVRGGAEAALSGVDAAWREYIQHTQTCTACQTGVDCADVAAFKAAWRAARDAVRS
jgi:hypothetical protein